MADLTTLANVKAWANVKTTDDDALLTRLISAASEYIQTWLNRSFASQAYNEVRDGNGNCRMVFAESPVTAVSSLVVNGRPIPASAGFGQAGYSFDKTMLKLTGYTFERGIGNVLISYTAGYAATPPEIEQACIDLISLRYKERDRIGHQSKSLAGETVTFFIKDMPDSVQTILNNYRKVIPL